MYAHELGDSFGRSRFLQRPPLERLHHAHELDPEAARGQGMLPDHARGGGKEGSRIAVDVHRPRIGDEEARPVAGGDDILLVEAVHHRDHPAGVCRVQRLHLLA